MLLSLWNGHLQRYTTCFFPFRLITVCLLLCQTESRSRRSLPLKSHSSRIFSYCRNNLNQIHSNLLDSPKCTFRSPTQPSLHSRSSSHSSLPTTTQLNSHWARLGWIWFDYPFPNDLNNLSLSLLEYRHGRVLMPQRMTFKPVFRILSLQHSRSILYQSQKSLFALVSWTQNDRKKGSMLKNPESSHLTASQFCRRQEKRKVKTLKKNFV